MFSRKIVFSLALFFLFFSTSAQNKALNAIDISDLKKHLSIIASDSLMGRQIGAQNDGLEMTADYIQNSIKDIGLSMVNGSYTQPFSLFTSQPDPSNSFIQANDRNDKLIFRSDSVVSLSGNSDIKIENAEVVFAGFGIDSKMKNISEVSNISGKVVMMLLGDENSFEQRKISWNERSENEKINRAIDNGATGVILVTFPFDNGNVVYTNVKQRMERNRFSLKKPQQQDNMNKSILIPASLAEKILGGEGQLDAQLKKLNKVRGNDIQSDIQISIYTKRLNKEISVKNIWGLVEGSDPELKDECIVLMAHYDHLGIDGTGDVFNGADDNGSGVVTLLEVADAMVKTPQKPKRSVLFLWVTAEEIGLFGSDYYTSNPAFPLEKTVTCINIDMNGRVYEPRDSVWKDSPKKVKDFDGLYTLTDDTWPDLKQINSEKCEELGLVPDYSLPANFLRSSDHFHFHNSGVPILNFATGYHYDYHKVTDEISRINFDKMKRVADLSYLVIYEIANRDVIDF